MKTPHWWQVEEGPEAFAEVFIAARELGLRLGWLELEAELAPPSPLAEAAALGAMRAVAVTPGRTLAVKPLRGAVVPKDLLREFFLGCAAVLVRGPSASASARLRRGAAGFFLDPAAGEAALGPFPAEVLVARLRKPRPTDA